MSGQKGSKWLKVKISPQTSFMNDPQFLLYESKIDTLILAANLRFLIKKKIGDFQLNKTAIKIKLS